ncbi:oxidation resistance protein 1 isoform X3 [Cervus elaphus]|uniref:oxidation resistance protein 1 isoform X3 n=1 Tax=Cervus canadensis TaxID=1574408 RepID=UPI0018B86062|nr:oxidation resistance protein 1 isoform X3 [Cervus canadensis]XP_043735320.1 oxidation resistance protein 1 isoform X3 [Cervus elaphus]
MLLLKKKSQSVDITAPGFNPLAGAGKQMPQASKPPAPKTPIIEEEQNNTANSQKHPSRRSELKRFYTIDTGQKKTLDKKDGRRMSFQKPKGTIEYTVESRDSLNSIALKFDTTPNELVQLNKLFSRAVVTGQVLYVPDPEYVSSVESSPSLSPISPLSPTSSEAEFEKTTTPDVVHPKEATPSSAFTAIRPARVVSSTSEEEEAFTEKFLKINCRYITSGKGTVSGVLLVTPNNIMFDPHKTDPLVQENGCEEYGIMCPMEEVMSAAMYKEILDSKIKESLPIEIDQLSGRDFCHLKKVTRSNTDEVDSRIRDAGNDSASTAPRSTEESLSEDVFTESELSPIREELISSDELRHDKSSGASSESVQTVTQSGVECLTVISEAASTPDHLKSGSGHTANEVGTLSLKTGLNLEMATKEGDQATDNLQKISGLNEQSTGIKKGNQDFPLNENSLHQEEVEKESMPCGEAIEFKQKQVVNKGKQGREQNQDSETEVEELRKLWKSHSMQQTKQQRENIQQVSQKEIKHKIATADIEGSALLKEKRRHRLHKFLCLRVGKPMRKTFVSQASATMQQYAQRDKKHEYWFAVPQERTDHLYAFFIQWSPETYAEDTGEYTKEPGFIVVKKIEESETNEDSTSEAAAREWEIKKEENLVPSNSPEVEIITTLGFFVVSVAEYHRRIDALNTEELRTLCRRLQITTREDINSKQITPVKADLESESFRPNLSDPSDLLLPDQIEKLTKHLPPRTIGYPWTLVYGTGKHGTSLKTLYRTMTGLDTPVLMVIKDSDGQVFGALASEPFKVSDGFYGTGETFVFTFCPDFEVFKWTGDNMFFIKGDMDSLAFGGGGGEFALWLDGDLYHGRSHSCKTFGNHTLSKKEDFFIQDIEIWAFE